MSLFFIFFTHAEDKLIGDWQCPSSSDLDQLIEVIPSNLNDNDSILHIEETSTKAIANEKLKAKIPPIYLRNANITVKGLVSRGNLILSSYQFELKDAKRGEDPTTLNCEYEIESLAQTFSLSFKYKEYILNAKKLTIDPKTKNVQLELEEFTKK
jgi:hypothetical protein